MAMVLTLLAFLIAAPESATAAPLQTRMEVLDMGTLDTGRPSKINVWYPRGECPANRARLCLADSAVTSKVVVFSHGSMGSADNYSWLGEGLATAGFVVVGVNHYGESSISEKCHPGTCEHCIHVARVRRCLGFADTSGEGEDFPAGA